MKIRPYLAIIALTATLLSCQQLEPTAQKAAELSAPKVVPANKVKLQLPECTYGVPGKEINIYFDNIVLVINPDNYVFDVTCPKGRNDRRRWRFTPTPEDVGSFDWSIKVLDENGVQAEGSMKIHIAPANAGEGKEISLLVVGDSLTRAGVYPTRIFEDFQEPGNPKLKMAGSNGPGYKPQPDGVAHEGWGGWRWDTFLNRKEPPSKDTTSPTNIASRFINKVGDEYILDFKNYFNLYNGGRTPDFITFQLGVNDVFGATDENLQERIAFILKNAETLITAIRKEAPEAIIGVGLVTPGAATQDAFGKNYACGQTRWQYKKNQHTLNQAMLDKFTNYPDKKLSIIPSNLCIDCENNFPIVAEPVNLDNPENISRLNNGVHPAPAGYKQMGDLFYAWLKFNLK